MTNIPQKSMDLVISAIKNLRERRGSSSHEILNYISSIRNVPRDTVKRQVLTALKRGKLHGILRETDGHYSLPIDRSRESTEIAKQELGLLDLSCRKRKQQQRKRSASRGCGDTKKRKKKSRKRSRKSSKSRKMSGCGGSSSRKKKSRRSKKKRKSRSKYNCDKVTKRKSKKRMGCGTKKRSKSRKRRRRREKKGKPCTCPPKNTNKCTMNFLE